MALPSLRTKKIVVERLGLTLTIRELSGADLDAINTARKDETRMVSPLVCKLGVPEWSMEPVEKIAESVGAMVLQEIGAEIYELTGINLAKNSEPGQSESSTSS